MQKIIPDISIITTVKNGERYILEMLYSVSRQSYNNYEHIIVDDGSTDGTLSILRQFAEEHDNYSLRVFSEGPMGRGRALNFAVDKAKAPWVAIIDADDLWHHDKLKCQLNVLGKSFANEKIAVLATRSRSFHGEAPKEENIILDSISIKTTEMKDFLVINPISHSSVLIRKEKAYYNEDRISQFDLELWLRLISKHHSIQILDKELTFHRKHENQSFEAKLGNRMLINSFKLKANYSLRYGYFFSLIKSATNTAYVLTGLSGLRKNRKAG